MIRACDFAGERASGRHEGGAEGTEEENEGDREARHHGRETREEVAQGGRFQRGYAHSIFLH